MQGLSERLHVSKELLIHCFDYSLIEIEGRGERIDLSGGTVLRMRRLQRLAEHLDIDVAIAAILLERTERISRLERELKTLRRRIDL